MSNKSSKLKKSQFGREAKTLGGNKDYLSEALKGESSSSVGNKASPSQVKTPNELTTKKEPIENRKSSTKGVASEKKSPEPKVSIHLVLSKSLHAQFKTLAFIRGSTMSESLIQLIEKDVSDSSDFLNTFLSGLKKQKR